MRVDIIHNPHFAAEMYVNEVSKGLCDPQAKPTIIKETPSTAYVDGHNGIGSVRMTN